MSKESVKRLVEMEIQHERSCSSPSVIRPWRKDMQRYGDGRFFCPNWRRGIEVNRPGPSQASAKTRNMGIGRRRRSARDIARTRPMSSRGGPDAGQKAALFPVDWRLVRRTYGPRPWIEIPVEIKYRPVWSRKKTWWFRITYPYRNTLWNPSWGPCCTEVLPILSPWSWTFSADQAIEAAIELSHRIPP